jgi:hypothetical protein
MIELLAVAWGVYVVSRVIDHIVGSGDAQTDLLIGLIVEVSYFGAVIATRRV